MANAKHDSETLLAALNTKYRAAEGASFAFHEVDSILTIQVRGTDVHPSLRNDTASNKDQIDLTYGPTLPSDLSPVEEFFPALVKPRTLPVSRHLKIDCRIWGECLGEGAVWVADFVDVVRIDRNNDANPGLQLRGIDRLRRIVREPGWLIFVHRRGQIAYEAFRLEAEEWSGPKKQLYRRDEKASRVDFSFTDITQDIVPQDEVLRGIVATFVSDAATAGVSIDRDLARCVVASLLAKPFAILTGLSGSGKTLVAIAFARWLTPYYRVVAVGADWTGNENVMGYADGLRAPVFAPDGSVAEAGTYVAKPALEMILQANSTPAQPAFLILDEMNLSHVERYFADLLSGIESGEELTLYCDALEEGRPRQTRGIPPLVRIPKNLFVVGTVNVDESTYMFSPKVLDRANVIEFRVPFGDMQRLLGQSGRPNLDALAGRGGAFCGAFVAAAMGPATLPEDVGPAYAEEMLLFFECLQEQGAEFGYRVAYEAGRFMMFYGALGERLEPGSSWFPEAFDRVILQKLLPKLHGSRTKLAPVLRALWFLCMKGPGERGDAPVAAAGAAARSTARGAEPNAAREAVAAAHYKLSAEKIGRMWRLLNENGFASFAEA